MQKIKIMQKSKVCEIQKYAKFKIMPIKSMQISKVCKNPKYANIKIKICKIKIMQNLKYATI